VRRGVDYDAITVGGGHAGIEAALALARLGFKTLMITQNPDRIGTMSCNPAIGGLSKGNLVREIDALGGEMGRLIDATMIQFRMLNTSRGPAVQAPRAQADKLAYSCAARLAVERQAGLSVFMDTVVDFILDSGGTRVEGVRTARGHEISAKAVVLTTGTFMDGKIFIGEYSAQCGRLGEEAALGLGSSLRRLGFSVGRLKTGTPARVRRDSIDLSVLEEQKGDPAGGAFSFWGPATASADMSCWIGYTNAAAHEVIRANIHRSPLYGGKIIGRGPRYCPSIEDKVMRFPERERHQVFVEPEGRYTDEMYLNGLSSSLPEDVQVEFLKKLKGFEEVRVVRPAYAVEYDYLDPIQLRPSLETKRLEGLFVAGQTNGSSGYEEAAAQGLLAGINAAQKLRGEAPLVLSRAEAYIGVLVDDLVTMGTKEPYRMFTSRAEYRLNLRHDSSDARLAPQGLRIGLLPPEAAESFERKRRAIEAAKELCRSRYLRLQEAHVDERLSAHVGHSLAQALSDPEVDPEKVWALEPGLSGMRADWRQSAYLDIRYAGYMARQDAQIERFGRMETKSIPEDLDYDRVVGLSTEAREKLKAVRPLSLGQASRVNGVRQADIALLMMALERGTRSGD
jgi:tRNA uridine 5-carboxymethylaminomethyl modification enzyme